MKKILVGLLLLLSSFIVGAQKYTDPITLFKMMLYLDKDNINFNEADNLVKNDSLYDVFRQYYILKLDTLMPENKNYQDDLTDKYEFYKLYIEDLKGNRKLTHEESQYLGIFVGATKYYVLGINSSQGVCYRLYGFRINDFLAFLSDIKSDYGKKNNRNTTNSFVLKNFKVTGLDFECLYKGLRAKNYDTNKYPCLKRCSEPFEAHALIK